MPDQLPDLDAIFCEAIELRSPEDRADFVTRACAGDETLRQQVESLVAAHFRAGSFLDQPPIPATPIAPEAPGTFIGPYKLLEQIGEGGMGIVYVAEQTHPVRRRVALKLIKPGMDTREVVARFEAERQALALMDHHNIAKFLDAGTTGLPSGGRKPPVSDPPVSDPPVSDPPVSDPPVLDRSRGTHVPRSGVPYFVMELVRGLPITEYCDRAALTPRDRLRLFAQVCRAVQHAHMKGVIHRDLKPSNVLVTLHDGTPVPKVIDFGVAKALGQSLTERTLSTRFAQMVGTPLYMAPEQAELSGLDVDTRADVYSLGVLLYELLTGTTPFDADTLRRVGLDELRRMIREDEPPRPSQRLSQMRSAERGMRKPASTPHSAFRIPNLKELDWVVMRCLEKDRNRRYDSAGALAADVERYLADEPVEARPPSWSYRLRKSARRNRAALATAGVVAATLVAATAVSVWEALRATDAQHRAEADRDRAEIVQRQAELAEGHAATEAAIARAVNDFLERDLLGQVNSEPRLLEGFNGNPRLTVKETLDRAADKIGTRFQDQPLVEAAIRMAIGKAYRALNQNLLAVPHLERGLELRRANLDPAHPDTLDSMDHLARAYSWAMLSQKAIALRQEILERQRVRLGPDNPVMLSYIRDLALAYQMGKQPEKCIPLYEKLLNNERIVHGPTHSLTLTTMHDLAMSYWNVNRLAESLELHQRLLGALISEKGIEHPSTIWPRLTFAQACLSDGQLDRADQLLREALAAIEKQESTRQLRRSRARILGYMALTLCLKKRYADAEPLVRETVAVYEREPTDNPGHFYWVSLLGESLLGQQRFAEAEPLILRGYEEMKKGEAKHHIGDRRIREAGERVIRFYEVTGQPEKVREWRAKISSTTRPQ